MEDAIQAMRNMNGKQVGGDQIRVDFLRSQPSRRVSYCILELGEYFYLDNFKLCSMRRR